MEWGICYMRFQLILQDASWWWEWFYELCWGDLNAIVVVSRVGFWWKLVTGLDICNLHHIILVFFTLQNRYKSINKCISQYILSLFPNPPSEFEQDPLFFLSQKRLFTVLLHRQCKAASSTVQTVQNQYTVHKKDYIRRSKI